MKKVVSLILALALLMSFALADDWQDTFEKMSLEELQALAAAADAEIVRRTTESFEVPTGIYIIGEDIPAGTYRIERCSNSALVYVWKNQREYNADFYSYIYGEGLYKDDPTIGKIVLSEGNVLKIDATVKFSLYKGLGW